jgi:TonB family protein
MRRSLSSALFFLVCVGPAFSTAQQDETIRDNETALLRFAELEYPKRASQARIHGIVVVRTKLDDSGNVDSATALSGAELLIPECLDNAKKWRFRPNPKKAAVIVYNFELSPALKPGCSSFVVEPPNFATITTCASEIR